MTRLPSAVLGTTPVSIAIRHRQSRRSSFVELNGPSSGGQTLSPACFLLPIRARPAHPTSRRRQISNLHAKGLPNTWPQERLRAEKKEKEHEGGKKGRRESACGPRNGHAWIDAWASRLGVSVGRRAGRPPLLARGRRTRTATSAIMRLSGGGDARDSARGIALGDPTGLGMIGDGRRRVARTQGKRCRSVFASCLHLCLADAHDPVHQGKKRFAVHSKGSRDSGVLRTTSCSYQGFAIRRVM